MACPLVFLVGDFPDLHPAVQRALKCLEGNYKNRVDLATARSLSIYLHDPHTPLFGSHENAWGDLTNMLSKDDQDYIKGYRTDLVVLRGMRKGEDAYTYGLPLCVYPFSEEVPSLEEQEVEEWHDIEVYGDAYETFTAKHPDLYGDISSEYAVLNKLEEEHNRDILRCGWDQLGDCWDFKSPGGWWFMDVGGGNYIWRFIPPASFENQRFSQLVCGGAFMEETLDDQERIVTDGIVSKKGPNYMTASTKYGDCYIPLKFTRYVGEIGEHIKLLARFKDLSYASPLLCAKVLKGEQGEPGYM